MPYEILLQHASIVSCLCVFGISHFGLYYLYSSTINHSDGVTHINIIFKTFVPPTNPFPHFDFLNESLAITLDEKKYLPAYAPTKNATKIQALVVNKIFVHNAVLELDVILVDNPIAYEISKQELFHKILA